MLQVYVSSCPVDGTDWDSIHKVSSTLAVLEREVETVGDVTITTASNSLIKLKRDVAFLSDSVAKLRCPIFFSLSPITSIIFKFFYK